jgi:hypothetical protein
MYPKNDQKKSKNGGGFQSMGKLFAFIFKYLTIYVLKVYHGIS